MKEIIAILTPWLKAMLKSNEIDFYILHELKNQNILFEPYYVSIREHNNARLTPIKKSQGYLNFPKNENLKETFTELIKSGIQKKEYSIEGLANYFIFIDQLGSITEDDQYEISKEIAAYIPKDEYLAMTVKLILYFNKEYNFSDFKSKNISFNDWTNLFIKIQYLDRIDNPIGLLRRIINFKIQELPILNLISSMSPDTRAALFEYGLDLSFIKENEIIIFLENNKSEIPFYTAYISNEYSEMPTFLDEKLAKFLVQKNWEISGHEFFRLIYGNKKRNLNELTSRILSKEVDQYLIDTFVQINTKKQTNLSTFIWPIDYLALGGWLVKINDKNGEKANNVNEKFVNDLVSEFGNIINTINKKIPSYINKSENSYHIWLPDVFDVKSQFMTGYIMWSIDRCDKETYLNFHSCYKKLCLEIKELYYGSFEANNLAQKLSNYLLCFLFSYPKIENPERLVGLIEFFLENIGYQWVIFTERNKMIWKDDSINENNLSDSELLYISKRLKDVPENFLQITDSFKAKISEFSSVTWPIYV